MQPKDWLLPGSYVRYMAHVYQVIWRDGDRVYIGVPGYVYPGYWMPTGTIESLRATHHTLSIKHPFLSWI